MAIDRLAGDDARWTDTLMDPSRSVGATADARALRLLAAPLESEAPGLIAATSVTRGSGPACMGARRPGCCATTP